MPIQRVPHYLGSNHRSTTLRHLFSVDTEAYRTTLHNGWEWQTLRLGCVEYWSPPGNKQPEQLTLVRFKTCSEFWGFVMATVPDRQVATIIAHNAAYDMRLLDMWHELPNRGFRATLQVIDSPPFIYEWVSTCEVCDKQRATGSTRKGRVKNSQCGNKHVTLRIWDTTNVTPGMPLNALAKTLDDRKLEMPAECESDEDWFTYCAQDTRLLGRWYRSYVAWLQANDMGVLCPTIAGQAWHAYLHRFKEAAFYIHCNETANILERLAYIGGRVECFRVGQLPSQRWYQLDVNSLYPYAMATTEVPVKLVTTATNPTLSEVRKWVDKYCVIATVTLHTDQPCYPVKIRGRLLFPTGNFTTTLCTPELQYALAMNHVVSASRLALYTKQIAFARYVEHLYAQRLKAKAEQDWLSDFICKLLLNSLYGKFGQLSPVWEEVGMCDPQDIRVEREYDVETHKWVTTRHLAGRMERKVGSGEHLESFPGVAAHVTSAGRRHLWRLICQAGLSHCVYTDTDSLIVDQQGYDALSAELHQSELGRLKLEASASDCVITAPKVYRLGEKQRRKGVSKSATLTTEGKWKQMQWHSLKWGIANGEMSAVLLEPVEKLLSGEYLKGTVLPNGRIEPFVLTLD